jgi:hypothetical protein
MTYSVMKVMQSTMKTRILTTTSIRIEEKHLMKDISVIPTLNLLTPDPTETFLVRRINRCGVFALPFFVTRPAKSVSV